MILGRGVGGNASNVILILLTLPVGAAVTNPITILLNKPKII